MSAKTQTVHVAQDSMHKHKALDKQGDCSARMGCTETLLFPTCHSSALQAFYGIRYWLIRSCAVPVPYLPTGFPVVGGKTLFELMVMIVITVIAINYVYRMVVPIQAGQVTANIAAVAISCGFRNNVLTIVFGISFERALFWHKFGVILFLTLGIIHGVRETPQLSGISSSKNLLGLIILCLGGTSAIIYFTKQFYNKAFKFEWFYGSHVLLAIGVIIVAFLHGATQVLYAGVAWAVDLTIRYLLLCRRIQAKARVLPCGVVKIQFPKSFEYSAGQYCFLMVPGISQYQFHPFSISSAPHEENMSFHIRSLGDWTSKLKDHVTQLGVAQDKQPSEDVDIDVCIEGPIGFLSVNLNDAVYKVVLLVAGGIGVTPTQSVLNDLVYKHGSGVQELQKCLMVWSVKDKAMADEIDVASRMKLEEGGSQDLPISFQPDLIRLTQLNNTDERGRRGTAEELDNVVVPELTVDSLRAQLAANKNLNNATVFQGEFYLTSVRNEQDFLKANIDIRSQPYLSFGRPQLADIVKRVAAYCASDVVQRGARVAVIVCGPTEMVNELNDICNCEQNGIRFDVHQEIFSF